MKINRVITEERTVQMELQTPYFCKYGCQFLAVIDEKNCIEVHLQEATLALYFVKHG
jgi:hypothetical protein